MNPGRLWERLFPLHSDSLYSYFIKDMGCPVKLQNNLWPKQCNWNRPPLTFTGQLLQCFHSYVFLSSQWVQIFPSGKTLFLQLADLELVDASHEKRNTLLFSVFWLHARCILNEERRPSIFWGFFSFLKIWET